MKRKLLIGLCSIALCALFIAFSPTQSREQAYAETITSLGNNFELSTLGEIRKHYLIERVPTESITEIAYFKNLNYIFIYNSNGVQIGRIVFSCEIMDNDDNNFAINYYMQFIYYDEMEEKIPLTQENIALILGGSDFSNKPSFPGTYMDETDEIKGFPYIINQIRAASFPNFSTRVGESADYVSWSVDNTSYYTNDEMFSTYYNKSKWGFTTKLTDSGERPCIVYSGKSTATMDSVNNQLHITNNLLNDINETLKHNNDNLIIFEQARFDQILNDSMNGKIELSEALAEIEKLPTLTEEDYIDSLNHLNGYFYDETIGIANVNVFNFCLEMFEHSGLGAYSFTNLFALIFALTGIAYVLYH